MLGSVSGAEQGSPMGRLLQPRAYLVALQRRVNPKPNGVMHARQRGGCARTLGSARFANRARWVVSGKVAPVLLWAPSELQRYCTRWRMCACAQSNAPRGCATLV